MHDVSPKVTVVENSGEKSAVIAKIPQSRGGALYAGGVPGNRGGSGRPANKFRKYCQRETNRKEVRQAIRAVLENPESPAFATLVKHFHEMAYGKAVQKVEETQRGRVEHLHSFEPVLRVPRIGAGREGQG